MVVRYRSFWLFCLTGCVSIQVSAQTVIDSFERDLSNWLIVEGLAEIQGANEYSGANSVRLHRRDAPIGAQTTLLHRTFQDNFGIYDVACYADGPVSDIQFLFQYIDNQNYYGISSNPRLTDNPQLILWKVVNGVYTLLDSIGPVMDLNKWYKLRVERFCSGEISVYVGDAIGDTLRIQVMDRSILAPGTIGLASWAESTFFDDVAFLSKNSGILTELDETICSGSFYQLGDNRYSQKGIYYDTLLTADGCDSVIKVDLKIAPHYIVTVSDTVCAHEGYLLGSDTLRISGNYNGTFQSAFGCDSLVTVNLLVLEENQVQDTLLCNGQVISFGDDTIRDAGTYYDTLVVQDGCLSIVQLNVTTNHSVDLLGTDQTVCFDNIPSIPLRVIGYDSVRWSDGRSQETIAINAPGVYSVQVFDGFCSLRDTIEILEACESQPGIYVPNAFSPNDDNVNDFFRPNFVQVPQNYSLKIFNRWGDMIYSSTNLDPGWDGRVNGRLEPNGVFIYLIETDTELLTGTVTLIR